MRHLRRLIELLPPEADLLELGCGAGVTSTKILAEHGRLTGVDISPTQLRRARRRVPHATFLHADLQTLELPAASFDAVVALYVLGYLPAAALLALLERVARWLRPGGLLLATVGVRSHPGDEGDVVREAGLELLAGEEEAGRAGALFAWVLARKPG